jgi:hypothetical protein
VQKDKRRQYKSKNSLEIMHKMPKRENLMGRVEYAAPRGIYSSCGVLVRTVN